MWINVAVLLLKHGSFVHLNMEIERKREKRAIIKIDSKYKISHSDCAKLFVVVVIYFYLVFSAFCPCCSFWWFHGLVCKMHRCQCEEYPFVSWIQLYILTIRPCRSGKLFKCIATEIKKKRRKKEENNKKSHINVSILTWIPHENLWNELFFPRSV